MNNIIVVVLISALAGVAAPYEQVGLVEELNGRRVSATLFLSNPFDAGDWGPVDTCEQDSFVHAIEVLDKEQSLFGDNTALNAVRLYCSTQAHHDTGYATSATAPEGVWKGMQICSEKYVTGFRGKVLPYFGIFTDNIAVLDFEAECNFGEEIIGGNSNMKQEKKGDWSMWTQCERNTSVCGLQTRVMQPTNSFRDNVALTDINLFCCPLTAESTVAPTATSFQPYTPTYEPTDAPTATSLQPSTSTYEPTDAPTATSLQPSTSTYEPTDAPTATSLQPSTSTYEPTDAPTATSLQPSTSTYEPTDASTI